MSKDPDVLGFISRFNVRIAKYGDVFDLKDKVIPIRSMTLVLGNGIEIHVTTPLGPVIRVFYSDECSRGASECEVTDEIVTHAAEFFGSSRFIQAVSIIPEFNFIEHIPMVKRVKNIVWGGNGGDAS